MDFLGIDYGTKKIGLSWGDDGLKMAVPIEPIVGFHTLEEAIEEIAHVVKLRGVQALVLGYPLNMDDTRGKRVVEVEKFAKMLEERLGLPIHFSDERLTTFEAQNVTKKSSLKNKKREKKGLQDSIAAACILSDFFEG